MKWEPLARAKPRGPNQTRCNLCSKEIILLMSRSSISLNHRDELGGYCPHKRVHLLNAIQYNKEVMKERAKAKKKIKKARKNGVAIHEREIT